MIITTQQGDVLDLLCFQYLGSEQVVVDVLQNNPQLAGMDEQHLPAGIEIDLGEVPVDRDVVSQKSAVFLWD